MSEICTSYYNLYFDGEEKAKTLLKHLTGILQAQESMFSISSRGPIGDVCNALHLPQSDDPEAEMYLMYDIERDDKDGYALWRIPFDITSSEVPANDFVFSLAEKFHACDVRYTAEEFVNDLLETNIESMSGMALIDPFGPLPEEAAAFFTLDGESYTCPVGEFLSIDSEIVPDYVP